MAEKEKKYFVAPKTAIVSKGVVLEGGEVVSSDSFLSKDVFDSLLKAKKILEESDFNKALSGVSLKGEKSEGAGEEKKGKSEEKK